MTAVSKEFNILEYLNPNTDWFGKKRNSVPFVMPSFYQNKDDDEGQDGLNNVLRRHLRPNSNAPPIVIRQIRHIVGPIAMRGMWEAPTRTEYQTWGCRECGAALCENDARFMLLAGCGVGKT